MNRKRRTLDRLRRTALLLAFAMLLAQMAGFRLMKDNRLYVTE